MTDILFIDFIRVNIAVKFYLLISLMKINKCSYTNPSDFEMYLLSGFLTVQYCCLFNFYLTVNSRESRLKFN